jgi:hypothetical protein
MERIGALLPIGSGDPSLHHGARRRSRRFPLNAEVDVIEPHSAEGVTLNASAGGIRIVVNEKLEPGSICLLEVHFTNERTSAEKARVVWAREMGDGWIVGLEFTNIDWNIPNTRLSQAA